MAIGYVGRKCHVLNDTADATLSRIVLDITLPCMMIGAALGSESLPSRAAIWTILGTSFAGYALIICLSLLVPLILHLPRGHRGAYSFMTTFGNVGFIGIPVCATVFGPEAVLYVAILNIPFNLFCFTVGVLMISDYFPEKDTAALDGTGQGQSGTSEGDGDDENAAGGMKTVIHQPATDWQSRLRAGARGILSPVFISCVAAMVLALAGITCDNILTDTLTLIGDMSIPAGLLIVGSSLARMPFAQMMGDWRSYAVSVFRLLVVPLVLLGLLKAAGISDALLVGSFVLTSGAPVATNGTILAIQHGGDLYSISKGTFVSTIFALATMPLLVSLVL